MSYENWTSPENFGDAAHHRQPDADVQALEELKDFMQHVGPQHAARAQQIFGTLGNWNLFRVCLQETLDSPNHLRDYQRTYESADSHGLVSHQKNHVMKILQHAVQNQRPLAESLVAYLDSGNADLADERDHLDRITRYARGGSPEQEAYARDMALMQRDIAAGTLAANRGISVEQAKDLLS